MSTDVFTFGSFNNIAKVSDACVALWAAVLKNVPSSRLIIKSGGLTDSEDQHVHRARFERYGVGEQVKFLPKTKGLTAHLSCYGMIDLCLDTFPYHGTTTSCEAFFMGLPVLFLIGEVHASRVGLSLLSVMGLDDFICHSVDDFVRQATYWSARDQWETLSHLRSTQRARLKRSKLCAADEFTAQFYATLSSLYHSTRGASDS
jgi:predicted O-linked N-acetylglucosamine transferase (SPINDLY family)